MSKGLKGLLAYVIFLVLFFAGEHMVHYITSIPHPKPQTVSIQYVSDDVQTETFAGILGTSTTSDSSLTITLTIHNNQNSVLILSRYDFALHYTNLTYYPTGISLPGTSNPDIQKETTNTATLVFSLPILPHHASLHFLTIPYLTNSSVVIP